MSTRKAHNTSFDVRKGSASSAIQRRVTPNWSMHKLPAFSKPAVTPLSVPRTNPSVPVPGIPVSSQLCARRVHSIRAYREQRTPDYSHPQYQTYLCSVTHIHNRMCSYKRHVSYKTPNPHNCLSLCSRCMFAAMAMPSSPFFVFANVWRWLPRLQAVFSFQSLDVWSQRIIALSIVVRTARTVFER